MSQSHGSAIEDVCASACSAARSIRRIAGIAGRNRDGGEQVTTSAREQAAALRELEGATQELRNVAIYLGELTRRITSVT